MFGETNAIPFSSGVWFAKKDNPLGISARDINFLECKKILTHPFQQWLDKLGERTLLVTEQNGIFQYRFEGLGITLDDAGLEYTVFNNHPWAKVLNLNRETIIIQKDSEGNPSYIYNGINEDLWPIKRFLVSRELARTYYKSHFQFVIYTKDKIIPDELQKVLDEFGIEYQVKDNRILRRGL